MYYISILGGMCQDPFLFFFGMKGDKGLLWEGCKTCFFLPTKFCLIIMMHDQLWFNSYMWRKEQDTQTNLQTHTHTHHHLCMKCACYLNTLKSCQNPNHNLNTTQFNLNCSWVWYDYDFTPPHPTHQTGTLPHFWRDNLVV